MIVLIIIGTVLLIPFILCFIAADEKAYDLIIESQIMDIEEKKTELEIKMQLLFEDMKKRDELDDKKKLAQGKKMKKEYDEAEKALERLKEGKLGLIDVIPLAGYGLFMMLHLDAKNSFIRYLIKQCSKYRERRAAGRYAYYVAASVVGFFSIGLVLFFAVFALTLSMELEGRAGIASLVVLALFMIIGYLPLDKVLQTVQKRQEEINRQFPQVISKLTLLTEAGMEVGRAWNLTSESGNGVLYMEMNRVNRDLNNNVKPEEAYMSFIQRCSNTYTSKLASLIVQNMFKGNAEIVRQLGSLNTECWNEFRNNTQRMGEKVQTKLFIPTLIMFAAILILIIVPVLSSFGSI